MIKTSLAALAAFGVMISAAPAQADRDKEKRGYSRMYDDRGYYREPRRVTRNTRTWRGDDGRYYCRRENGTTGLIIGAAGGALLGRTIDTEGDRTVGTLLGGAAGALLGREIERGGARCR
ncbi:MAG: glycine zipper 2TM domain-containing protein [Alphaproteobacteria bacterium]|nr:glycine zipper 2TM domain-containing protein [Alphaproteobacteria bacterium]MBU0794852.1 glycine zipper 2TM domain-containing protein [Alphaproteobacteria bacterium]MBU0874620.1 glycine zipper 2TM domain-containing protein [Alphaproteobacteria bacterium]MBU1768044.1 glycine zipper 2TM domain-containing protein [Alphaproteobacteria bacterium]